MDAGGCVGAGASGSANVSTSAAAADVNEEPTFELVTNIGRLAVIRNGGGCVQQWRSGHNGLTVLQALPLKLIGFIVGFIVVVSLVMMACFTVGILYTLLCTLLLLLVGFALLMLRGCFGGRGSAGRTTQPVLDKDR
jgi:hypothetical protein